MEPDAKRRVLVPVVFDKECAKEGGKERCYACIVSETRSKEVEEALESFNLLVCYSADGKHLPDEIPDECNMVFICDKFEGKAFTYLNQKGFRILGPPCVLACAAQSKPLPVSSRPVYSIAMCDAVVCFTGYKDKDHLHELCGLVHWMGGSIRKEMVNSVTHVVADTVFGSKYKAAVFLNTPIMREEWVYSCWERKLDIGCKATAPELMAYKQLPFAGCKIVLFGFVSEEEQDMIRTAEKNGAQHVSSDSAGVTHLVVSDGVNVDSVPVISSRVMVVKQQWFWESIQIDACTDEMLYPVNDSALPVRRKRKRQSTSNSVLKPVAEAATLLDPHYDKRYHIAAELLQTEINYVSILSTVVKVFKEPLESPVARGGPLVSAEDVKGIFCNISDILEVHCHIKEALELNISHWNESSCIGTVFLNQADEILKVYPPFVNFFEMSKEKLHNCDKQLPRFHAFLKANESRAECKRQSLEELLITPIQRIPRIILLLQDLVKRTAVGHPDHDNLIKAVEVVRSTLTNINEDKRKTEKQMIMFEVVKEIEDCPANVLSSTRSFLRKLEVLDIGAGTRRGDPVVMFLFNDSIEVAKRKGLSTFAVKPSTKLYKHLEFISFQQVRSIVNLLQEKPELFGLLVQQQQAEEERLLVFQLSHDQEDKVTKEQLLDQLCRILAEINHSSDPAQFLVTTSSDILSGNKSIVAPGNTIRLKKAIWGARKRVQRAFSHRSKKPLNPSLQLNLPSASNDSFQFGSNDCTLDLSNSSISLSCMLAPVHTPTASNKRHTISRLPPISSHNTEV